MRRLNGEGNYFYNPKTKQWRWRIRYIDLQGKKCEKNIYSQDKTILKLKAKSFIAKLESNELNDRTVEQFCNIWLDLIVRQSCKRKTQQNYRTAANNHILPHFGKLKLSAVTTAALQEYLNTLLLDHSPITVISLRTIFIVFFNAAIDFGYLANNPAAKTRPPKRPKSSKTALSSDEIDRLFTAMNEQRINVNEATDYLISGYITAVQLALQTGMRQGEIFGLIWKMVDTEGAKLYVEKTLSSTHGPAQFDTPKTACSIRQIILAKSTVKLLADWRQKQAKYNKRFHGIYNNKNNLVFTNTTGSFISPTNFLHRFFKPALNRAKINNFTFHGLRHTHASKLLASGVDVQIVSHRLGHSSPGITMNVYAHLLPDSQELVRSQIDKIFQGDEPNE